MGKSFHYLLLFMLFFAGKNFSFSQATFMPNDISGLQMWLSADTGITLMGSNIQQWADRSGNGKNAIQNTPLDQPLLITNVNILNGFPVVQFNGTSARMLVDSNLNLGSVFVVLNWNGGSTFTEENCILSRQVYVPGSRFKARGAGFQSMYADYVEVFNTASRTFINSIQTLSFAPLVNYKILSATIFPLSFPNLVIGMEESTTFRAWEGDIAEIIIYSDSLTPAQRQQVEQYLSNKYAPPVNLGSDVTVNYGFCPVEINAYQDWFTSYQWSTGATADSISITNSGVYSVAVTNIFGYTSSDTISITYPGNFSPFPSQTICYGDTLKWNTQLDKAGYDFLWQDGSTDSVFVITQAGQYYVRVTDTIGVTGCIRYSDTINIAIDNFPQTASLGPNTSFCSGANIGLVSGASQATSYLWSTGATTSSIVITASGDYAVTVQNNNGCMAKDTLQINIKGVQPSVIFFSTNVCFGNPTQFTDLSTATSPDSVAIWLWDFGDASFNSVQNPAHTYTAFGTYTATLTVTTDSGCTASLQVPVTVNEKPAAAFNFASPSCSGGVTIFTDASSTLNGTLNAWKWNFGDPSSGTNDSAFSNNANHVFASQGTYTVQLIVTNNFGCTDTVTNIVTVLQSPAASFTADSVCRGNNTSFSGSAATTWQWNFGDGSPTNTFQNPTHLYSSAGTYTVILSVTAANGCGNKDTGAVIVYELPQPGFTGDSVCLGSPLQFLDTSSVSGSTINAWNWNFGPYGSSTLQNPSVTYTATGTNSVSLIVTSAQTCTATATHAISVQPLPAANFSFLPPYGAPPLTIGFSNLTSGGASYQWSFGDGGQSVQQNPSYTYQDTGLFIISLIAQSQFGCLDTVLDTIYVAVPLLDIAVKAISSIQANNTVQVSAILYNSGTLDVNSIELAAYLDNGTSIHESWAGLLKPRSFTTYQFHASFENVNNQHSVVCVDVKKVNGTEDDVSSNNHSCAPITTEFILIDPFPNPATDEIYFMFVAPDASPVKAQILDMRGRLADIPFDGEALQGLNQITYSTFKLEKGIYALKLSCQGKNSVKLFMKK